MLTSLSGYLIYYTTDSTRRHTDWVIKAAHADRLSTIIRDLRPDTTYYFKVAARNKAGYGPLSPTVIFHTAHGHFQYSSYYVRRCFDILPCLVSWLFSVNKITVLQQLWMNFHNRMCMSVCS